MRSYWLMLIRLTKAARQPRSLADYILFFEMFLFALTVPLLMRLKPVRLQSLLVTKKAGPSVEPARVQKIASYVESILRIGKPLVRRGCLTRGLTLYFFLRKVGLDVKVCFGMGNVKGEFVGHCWLIKDGEPFLESKDPRPTFTEILSIP